MKNKVFCFFIIILIYSFFEISNKLYAQNVFQNCPMAGSAGDTRHKEMNRKKNRFNIPTASQFDSSITLSNILQLGIDTGRFDETRAVIITGWVRELKWNSKESCNCKHTGQDSQDVHIEIVLTKNTTSRKKVFIAEITPRLRKRILNELEISSANPKLINGLLKDKLKHHQIKVKGWLFFDEEHKTVAKNTDPQDNQGKPNIRATVWEIHPITSIEIIE